MGIRAPQRRPAWFSVPASHVFEDDRWATKTLQPRRHRRHDLRRASQLSSLRAANLLLACLYIGANSNYIALNIVGNYNWINMPRSNQTTESRTARLTILIDPRKKKIFEDICAAQDLTPSQVVRKLIRQYVIEHAAGRPLPEWLTVQGKRNESDQKSAVSRNG